MKIRVKLLHRKQKLKQTGYLTYEKGLYFLRDKELATDFAEAEALDHINKYPRKINFLHYKGIEIDIIN